MSLLWLVLNISPGTERTFGLKAKNFQESGVHLSGNVWKNVFILSVSSAAKEQFHSLVAPNIRLSSCDLFIYLFWYLWHISCTMALYRVQSSIKGKITCGLLHHGYSKPAGHWKLFLWSDRRQPERQTVRQLQECYRLLSGWYCRYRHSLFLECARTECCGCWKYLMNTQETSWVTLYFFTFFTRRRNLFRLFNEAEFSGTDPARLLCRARNTDKRAKGHSLFTMNPLQRWIHLYAHHIQILHYFVAMVMAASVVQRGALVKPCCVYRLHHRHSFLMHHRHTLFQ